MSATVSHTQAPPSERPSHDDPARLESWVAEASRTLASLRNIAEHLVDVLPARAPLGESERSLLTAVGREAEGLAALIDSLESTQQAVPAIGNAPSAKTAPLGRSDQVERPSILVAEDDDEMRSLLAELLSARYQVAVAKNGEDALIALSRATFDLAIVDLFLPDLDGFRLAEEIRAAFGSRAPAFMFLTAHTSAEAKVRGLRLGAADYVTKPFDSDELLARVARIVAASERESSLRADAMTDPLTGLANYRSLMQDLARELDRARRYDQPLSLLTIDLDKLKAINDQGGHSAGNEAIALVAEVLTGAVRRFETVARQGGDEFAVLLPNTSSAEALNLAERLRAEVARKTCRGHALSISVGVASRERGSTLDLRGLVDASDRALYQAKHTGRNRVCAA